MARTLDMEPISSSDSQSQLQFESLQKEIFADIVSLLKQPSLEGVVAAAVDHISVTSTQTTQTKPSTPGAVLVGNLLEGYLPGQVSMAKTVVDTGLKYGIISEDQLRSLVVDPTPLTTPMKQLLENLNTKSAQAVKPASPTDALNSIQEQTDESPKQ